MQVVFTIGSGAGKDHELVECLGMDSGVGSWAPLPLQSWLVGFIVSKMVAEEVPAAGE